MELIIAVEMEIALDPTPVNVMKDGILQIVQLLFVLVALQMEFVILLEIVYVHQELSYLIVFLLLLLHVMELIIVLVMEYVWEQIFVFVLQDGKDLIVVFVSHFYLICLK